MKHIPEVWPCNTCWLIVEPLHLDCVHLNHFAIGIMFLEPVSMDLQQSWMQPPDNRALHDTILGIHIMINFLHCNMFDQWNQNRLTFRMRPERMHSIWLMWWIQIALYTLEVTVEFSFWILFFLFIFISARFFKFNFFQSAMAVDLIWNGTRKQKHFF